MGTKLSGGSKVRNSRGSQNSAVMEFRNSRAGRVLNRTYLFDIEPALLHRELQPVYSRFSRSVHLVNASEIGTDLLYVVRNRQRSAHPVQRGEVVVRETHCRVYWKLDGREAGFPVGSWKCAEHPTRDGLAVKEDGTTRFDSSILLRYPFGRTTGGLLYATPILNPQP